MATTTARKYPRIDDAEIARLRAMSVDDTLTLLGLYAKLDRDYNEGRRWPDWRTAEIGKAIEHDRSDEKPKDTARWRDGVR